MKLTAVFEPAEEGGYIEARENLKEALALMLEVNRENALEGVDESRIVRETLHINR